MLRCQISKTILVWISKCEQCAHFVLMNPKTYSKNNTICTIYTVFV